MYSMLQSNKTSWKNMIKREKYKLHLLPTIKFKYNYNNHTKEVETEYFFFFHFSYCLFIHSRRHIHTQFIVYMCDILFFVQFIILLPLYTVLLGFAYEIIHFFCGAQCAYKSQLPFWTCIFSLFFVKLKIIYEFVFEIKARTREL